MKRLIFCTVLTILSTQAVFAQAIFQRSYGGEGSEYGRAVIECSTGGYLLVGSTNSYFDPSTDMYILRVDEVGDYVWGRSIGMPNQIEWARDVKETADGNFLVAGYTNGTNSGDYDGTLTKLDPNGNVLWTKNYGNEDWDFIENMALSETGNIYLAGQSTLDGQLVGWLLKTTLDGDIIWERYFPGNGTMQLTGVDVCQTGQIVFSGYNYSVMLDQHSQVSGAVLENGDTNWVTSFPEFGNLSTQNCVCDYNNRILTSSTSHLDTTTTCLLSSINAETGIAQWIQTPVNFNRFGAGVAFKEDGNLLFAFSAYDFGYGLLDGHVHTRAPNGEWIAGEYTQVFGGAGMDVFHGVIPTSDGGYAAIGETNSFGNNYQMLLVKVNAENEYDQTNEDFLDLTTNTDDMEVSWSAPWPNPSTDILNIKSAKPQSDAVYHIIDGKGMNWKSGILKQKNGNASINVAKLSMGVYYLQIIHENGDSYTYKFMKAN